MTRLLVKLFLGKYSIYNNPDVLDIRLVINFFRFIKRVKKPNISRSILIIKRWD